MNLYLCDTDVMKFDKHFGEKVLRQECKDKLNDAAFDVAVSLEKKKEGTDIPIEHVSKAQFETAKQSVKIKCDMCTTKNPNKGCVFDYERK